MPQGFRRHLITVQSKSMVDDGFGGEVEEWANVVSVWTDARPLRGRQLAAARAEHNEVTTSFYCAYREDINDDMRIMWKGKPHDILAVIDIRGEGKELEIMTASGVNNG